MSGRSGDARWVAVKVPGYGILAVLLSMAASGGIADAFGASGPPLFRSPASPTRAASPPSLDRPVGGTVPDAPAVSPQNPNSTPMPAPATTIHYAGSVENASGCDQFCPARSASRRSDSFFTTA